MTEGLCPKDKTALAESVGLLEERVCARCAGRFVPARGVERALTVEQGIDFETLRELSALYAGPSIPCPGCGGGMASIQVKGMRLDHCLKCGGAWFDKGELARVSGGRHHEPEEPAPQETRGRPVTVHDTFEDESWPTSWQLWATARAALLAAALVAGVGGPLLALLLPSQVDLSCAPLGTKIRCDWRATTLLGNHQDADVVGTRLVGEIHQFKTDDDDERYEVDISLIGKVSIELLTARLSYRSAAEHMVEQMELLNKGKAHVFRHQEHTTRYPWAIGGLALGGYAVVMFRRLRRRALG